MFDAAAALLILCSKITRTVNPICGVLAGEIMPPDQSTVVGIKKGCTAGASPEVSTTSTLDRYKAQGRLDHVLYDMLDKSVNPCTRITYRCC